MRSWLSVVSLGALCILALGVIVTPAADNSNGARYVIRCNSQSLPRLKLATVPPHPETLTITIPVPEGRARSAIDPAFVIPVDPNIDPKFSILVDPNIDPKFCIPVEPDTDQKVPMLVDPKINPHFIFPKSGKSSLDEFEFHLDLPGKDKQR
jgi:hypothetical protein